MYLTSCILSSIFRYVRQLSKPLLKSHCTGYKCLYNHTSIRSQDFHCEAGMHSHCLPDGKAEANLANQTTAEREGHCILCVLLYCMSDGTVSKPRLYTG